MSTQPNYTPLYLFLPLTLVLAFGLLLARGCGTPSAISNGSKDGSPGAANPSESCSPEVDQQIAAIYPLHASGKWQEALDEWTKLQKQSDLCGRQIAALDLNLRLAQREVENTKSLTSQWERPQGDEKGKPKREEIIPPKTLLDYYPAGKKIRGLGQVILTGKGSHQQWFFQGMGHFAYESRLVTETTVKSNNGSRVVLEFEVVESAQIRALNQQDSLELAMPTGPVLTTLATLFDKGLSRHPAYGRGYLVARGIAQFLNQLDPGLKTTLTSIANQLRSYGQPLAPENEATEIVTQLGELTGQKLEIEYVADLGITSIQVLNGKTLPKDTLAAIAHNSSLLMDYYLFPATDKKVGESWEVEAANVAGLVQDGFDVQAAGKLEITRKPDIRPGIAELEATSGKISFAYDADGKAQETTIRPKKTSIHYSIDDKLVREARLYWQAHYAKFWTHHLLFGAQELADVELKSYYEAAIVK